MKRFAVIGLGNFGFHLAKALFEEGDEVVAIDTDRNRIQAVSAFSSEAMVLDATDKEALRALGLEETDAVIVSTGTKSNVSIMICLHLQEMGVRRIIVKTTDDDQEKILRRVGATDIIRPEREIAVRVARSLSRPNVLDYIPLSDDYDLVQFEPPEDFVGKSIKEVNLRAKYNVHVISIKTQDPENIILVPPADYVLKEGDVLSILGKSEDVRKIKGLK